MSGYRTSTNLANRRKANRRKYTNGSKLLPTSPPASWSSFLTPIVECNGQPSRPIELPHLSQNLDSLSGAPDSEDGRSASEEKDSHRDNTALFSPRPFDILLIEDDPADTRFICLLLERMQNLVVKVSAVDRLSKASEFISQSNVDLILLDLSLPDSSGLQTLRDLQAQASTIPIIVLTGLDDEEMSVSMLHQGAQDYLLKESVQSDTLRRSILYALERHRISQQLWEANQKVQKVNQELEDRVQERTRDLEQLNQRLVNEVEERRKAEEAALRLKDQAEQASQAKSQFLSRMSHEFRTPLNAVLGYGQLLEMKKLEGSQHRYVQEILHAGRHLLQLVEEVLDITRIERGNLELRIVPLRLADVLNEIIALVQPIIEQHQVHLNCDDTLVVTETMVQADKLRLKQILLNLISNAAIYNVAGGDVSLRGEQRDDYYRLYVTDTGRGIPEDRMSQLFLPFERLGVENQGIDGMGLGLAISHHLIHAMGGDIGVESIEGKGSTFFIDIPCSRVH